MIGVVIPAHNEARYIKACMMAMQKAAMSPRLLQEPVLIVVVLDHCTDNTGEIARSLGAQTLDVEARNVGVARSAGAQICLDAGARWLAFTDADTVVDSNWLAEQLRHRSDAVCGTISVTDWSEWGRHGNQLQRQFVETYTDADDHRHIHGANLGVSAEAYQRVGGFPPLASSEDVALVTALQAGGSSIAWSASPRVVTSARRDFRAPDGFGAAVLGIDTGLSINEGASSC